MRIMGPATATYDTVVKNLGAADPLFRTAMLPALWKAAEHYGVDPVGVVAQSAKETSFGRFTGAVTAKFYNTAGIKVRDVGKYPGMDDADRPLAHAQFATWDVGAMAHVQHLRAYAGAPVRDLVVDPRYIWVIGKHRLDTFEQLGGKWAPAADYGTTLVAMAQRLSVP
jgi:hypothetical protein